MLEKTEPKNQNATLPKSEPSTHLLDTPKPKFKHTYVRKTTHLSLPPLFISTALRGPKTSTLPRSTLAFLQQSFAFLGHLKTRSQFIGRDIEALRKELERGMSRDRRQQMRR